MSLWDTATAWVFKGRGEAYEIGSGLGVIHIHRTRGEFSAHCPLSHGPHSTPTMPECRKVVKAAKCPLGMLVAWLALSHKFADHAAHLEGRKQLTHKMRAGARRWKEKVPSLKPLFDYEREQVGVDVVMEPVVCP